MKIDYKIITQTSELQKWCMAAKEQPYITVDTEFVRVKTLFPNLGLIQLYDGHDLVLVDPIATDDLTPLWDLFCDPNIVKVLHACSEDLEVFQHSGNIIPKNLVDTQVIAAFLGYPVSTGYAKLVEDFLNIKLDKGASRTDWMARPLSLVQLDYAAADVLYLYPLYALLMEKLKESKWESALDAECTRILKNKEHTVNPDTLYFKVKNASFLEPLQLAVLQNLTKWRYRQAHLKNLPFNFVVREEHLYLIAKELPETTDDLADLRIDKFTLKLYTTKLLHIVAKTKLESELNYPAKITRLNDMSGYKQFFAKIKALIKTVAQEQSLAPEFIGSKRIINEYIKWVWVYKKDPERIPKLICDWRAELLGEALKSIDY